MPGFVFASKINEEIKAGALKKLAFDERYALKDIHKEKDYLLTVNSYKEYPIQLIELKNMTILVEGLIYNQSSSSLAETFTAFYTPASWVKPNISSWVRVTDGEFVVVMLHHGLRELMIINDAWGRLPVYYFKHGNSFVISREIAFVNHAKPERKADQAAAAAALLFGYPIGEYSLYEGIMRMPPMSVMSYDLRQAKLHVDRNFSLEINLSAKPQQVDTDKFISLLSKALVTRINKLQNPMLALSGGLDSRLLAAFVVKDKLDSGFLTYSDEAGSAQADVQVAKQIVERLGVQSRHTILNLHAETGQDVAYLLAIKQGLNYPGMAFILPFLEHFKFNSFTQITGDGGDKFLADLKPLIRLRTKKQLLRYLLRTQAIMPLEMVALLTQLGKNDILHFLSLSIESYGASSVEEQFAHFMIRERAMKWLFEGEDRNRYFSWCTSPYYNPELASKAMMMPMANKRNGLLFKQMLEALPGQLHELMNPNWRLPPADQDAVKRMFRRQQLKFLLPQWVMSQIKREVAKPELRQLADVKLQIEQHHLPEWFNSQALVNTAKLSYDAQWQITGLLDLWRHI
jgi:asparagine synthase (glutamine-hydrolysing)